MLLVSFFVALNIVAMDSDNEHGAEYLDKWLSTPTGQAWCNNIEKNMLNGAIDEWTEEYVAYQIKLNAQRDAKIAQMRAERDARNIRLKAEQDERDAQYGCNIN